jgi:hypothetical protein
VSGFCWFFGLFSFVRVIYLWHKSQHQQVSFLRPLLLTIVSALIICHTQYVLHGARQFARATALQLQLACKARQQCPRVPSGWSARADLYLAQTRFGDRVKWSFVYRADGGKFEIRLLKGLDLVEIWN